MTSEKLSSYFELPSERLQIEIARASEEYHGKIDINDMEVLEKVLDSLKKHWMGLKETFKEIAQKFK